MLENAEVSRSAPRLTALAAMVVVCCGISSCGSSAVAPRGKTIGLVLSALDYQLYTTKDAKEECPDGLVHSSKENWLVQFPTKAARKAHFDRCGAIDHRGPDCEHVLIAPDVIRDPLPYREVKGTKSFGRNLDGDEEGRGTATTCPHQNFISPDGTKGIDNQFYRLVGCQLIARSDVISPPALKGGAGSRTMLEIRGVDNEQNDDHVEVILYNGRDALVVDSQNNVVPWQSLRIDEGSPPQTMRGRIVDGELITEPADVSWWPVGLVQLMPILVRGSQLRLRLTDAGAQGLRTGYVDAKQYWQSRRSFGLVISSLHDSPPAHYEALYRLADGYKDPKTGGCTALSSSVKLEFVRANIVHPTMHLTNGERS